MATCPRCGEPMTDGICNNCGFPMNRIQRIIVNDNKKKPQFKHLLERAWIWGGKDEIHN